MSGPLSDLELPTGQELIEAGYAGFLKEKDREPAPNELLHEIEIAFWEWRNALIELQAAHLRERLGERLLKIQPLVEKLVLERVNCQGWEFPEPDECTAEELLDWTAYALAVLRWELHYGDDLLPEVGYAEVSAYLLLPRNRRLAAIKDEPVQLGLFDF